MKVALVKLAFGALSPKLHEQLQVPRRRLRYLQDCADSITTLAIGGILADAEVHRARKRLVKRIEETFRGFNGLKKRRESATTAGAVRSRGDHPS